MVFLLVIQCFFKGFCLCLRRRALLPGSVQLHRQPLHLLRQGGVLLPLHVLSSQMVLHHTVHGAEVPPGRCQLMRKLVALNDYSGQLVLRLHQGRMVFLAVLPASKLYGRCALVALLELGGQACDGRQQLCVVALQRGHCVLPAGKPRLCRLCSLRGTRQVRLCLALLLPQSFHVLGEFCHLRRQLVCLRFCPLSLGGLGNEGCRHLRVFALQFADGVRHALHLGRVAVARTPQHTHILHRLVPLALNPRKLRTLELELCCHHRACLLFLLESGSVPPGSSSKLQDEVSRRSCV
mmetsp:Transcript_250/g.528  ORF Transcript_250/g.528 Transcript_250/m.528 type:complete len:294 (+) Transcript_250:355-1236(+)